MACLELPSHRPRPLKDFYFTIDLRSLALYRILLASLLIGDWLMRWPDLETFYTSLGVFPVEAALPRSGGNFHFCLLDGVASLAMVRAVFCAGLLFYVLFLIGYRTRMFGVLSFLFFTSALSRNVLIRDGSVEVLATMLMWSLFLPMGKRFSLDALIEQLRRGEAQARPSEAGRCESSLAAFAIVAQLGLIYFFTAVAKSGETWKDGTALYYALNMDQIARPLGRWLAAQPLALIKALTWSALAMEFAALPMTLAPVAQPWLRRLAILGLAGLHLGIAATTTLGFFSVTMVATYALFLMPEDWDLSPGGPAHVGSAARLVVGLYPIARSFLGGSGLARRVLNAPAGTRRELTWKTGGEPECGPEGGDGRSTSPINCHLWSPSIKTGAFSSPWCVTIKYLLAIPGLPAPTIEVSTVRSGPIAWAIWAPAAFA
jgi:hypothetical protein